MEAEIAEECELKWGIWSKDPRVPRFSQLLSLPAGVAPPRWDFSTLLLSDCMGGGEGCGAAGNKAGSGIGPVRWARLARGWNNFLWHLLWFFLE